MVNQFINIADLKDIDDPEGRTFRQINNAMSHKIPIGTRVTTQIDTTLFVTRHTRDCDGTPLYSLGDQDGKDYTHGYTEKSISISESEAT